MFGSFSRFYLNLAKISMQLFSKIPRNISLCIHVMCAHTSMCVGAHLSVGVCGYPCLWKTEVNIMYLHMWEVYMWA